MSAPQLVTVEPIGGARGRLRLTDIAAEAETLAPGSPATAALTGDFAGLVLSLGIPAGGQGEEGEPGPKGDKGDTGNVADSFHAFAAGAAFAIDLALGTQFKCPTNGNAAITLPAADPGENYSVWLYFDAARTVTFTGGGTILWTDDVQPDPGAAAGVIAEYAFESDGTYTFARLAAVFRVP